MSCFSNLQVAIDSTHILAVELIAQEAIYRQGKAKLSQKLLPASSQDMDFFYVRWDWEGSANDVQVGENVKLKEMSRRENANVLVDTSYILRI